MSQVRYWYSGEGEAVQLNFYNQTYSLWVMKVYVKARSEFLLKYWQQLQHTLRNQHQRLGFTDHGKVYSIEIIFPLFFFKDKAHYFCVCVWCICIMQDTPDNPSVTCITENQCQIERQCAPSVFTKEMMCFSRWSHVFGKKYKIIAYDQIIRCGG